SWVKNGGSIALADDFQLSGGEAPGLSGSPLFSRELESVIGVVFAADPRGCLYAAQLDALAGRFPEFGDLMRRLNEKARPRRTAPFVLAALAFLVVATLLAWRPWNQPVDLAPGEIPVTVYRADGKREIMEPGGGFRVGELARF